MTPRAISSPAIQWPQVKVSALAAPGISSPGDMPDTVRTTGVLLRPLTLNLGLRYEATTPWVELNNRQDNLNLVTGAIEYAGVDGNSRALYNSEYGLPACSTPRRLRLDACDFGKAKRCCAARTPSPPTWKEPALTFAWLEILPSLRPKCTAKYTTPTVQTQSGPRWRCRWRSVPGSDRLCLG